MFDLWVVESNRINCDLAFQLADASPGLIDDEYYRNSVSILERRIATGGRRLALLLDSCFSLANKQDS
jgi:hypothetical protein